MHFWSRIPAKVEYPLPATISKPVPKQLSEHGSRVRKADADTIIVADGTLWRCQSQHGGGEG